MTRKHFMFLTAVVLIGMWAVSCAGDYSVNDTPINTAVKLQVGDISANTAEITLSPTQDVASFIVAGPAASTMWVQMQSLPLPGSRKTAASIRRPSHRFTQNSSPGPAISSVS